MARLQDRVAIVTGGIFPVDSGYSAFKGRADVMEAIKGGYRLLSAKSAPDVRHEKKLEHRCRIHVGSIDQAE